jgi:hypothetical protein
MSYVAPTSRADGYTVTASEWNQNAVDNPIALKALIDTNTASISALQGVEQTYASTGAQNDVAPSAGAIVSILCTGAAPVITGFSGGTASRKLLLYCKGTTLKVSDQTGSTAANQIICESAAGQIVGTGGVILLVYDSVASRWRASVVCLGTPISWTPAFESSAGGAATYTTQTGRYQQRGRAVSVWGDVTMATKGTLAAGNIRVTTLPFTVDAVSAPGRVGFWADIVGVVNLLAFAVSASTRIDLYHVTAAGAVPTQTQVADVSATVRLMFSADYVIA